MKCSECALDFLNKKILSLHIKLMHEENLTSNQPVRNFKNYNSCEKGDKIISEISVDQNSVILQFEVNDMIKKLEQKLVKTSETGLIVLDQPSNVMEICSQNLEFKQKSLKDIIAKNQAPETQRKLKRKKSEESDENQGEPALKITNIRSIQENIFSEMGKSHDTVKSLEENEKILEEHDEKLIQNNCTNQIKIHSFLIDHNYAKSPDHYIQPHKSEILERAEIFEHFTPQNEVYLSKNEVNSSRWKHKLETKEDKFTKIHNANLPSVNSRKKYACQNCDKIFSIKAFLTRHIELWCRQARKNGDDLCKNPEKDAEVDQNGINLCINPTRDLDLDGDETKSENCQISKIGTETLQKKGILKEPMYIDNRLPQGWYRKVSKRKYGKTAGSYDVYLFSPEDKRFRSKVELRTYFEKIGETRLQLEQFDFSAFGTKTS